MPRLTYSDIQLKDKVYSPNKRHIGEIRAIKRRMFLGSNPFTMITNLMACTNYLESISNNPLINLKYPYF